MPTAPKQHRPAHAQTRQQRDRERGTAQERGYDWDWHKVAEQRRRLDCYLCQECLRQGRIVASKLVDHIIPLWAKPDLRLDIDNTQVLCVSCNTRKGREDALKYGNGVRRNG